MLTEAFVEICKLKKFNYTKIDKSTVLRSGPNFKITYAFTYFSLIEIFYLSPEVLLEK